MSKVQEELGTWYMKNKTNKKEEVKDDNLYDVVVCDRVSMVVECITVWRKVSRERAIRLQDREQKGFNSLVVCTLSEKAIMGREINKEHLMKL